MQYQNNHNSSFRIPLVIDETQVINHNLGYRIWPSLAQNSITQVMNYNLGYDL